MMREVKFRNAINNILSILILAFLIVANFVLPMLCLFSINNIDLNVRAAYSEFLPNTLGFI